VSGSDTCRRTRIFRLFFLSSGVTSFAAQFAYLIGLRNVFWTQISFEKILTTSQANSATSNRRFEFHKRRQLFIGARNEALTIVAMCVCKWFVHVGFIVSGRPTSTLAISKSGKVFYSHHGVLPAKTNFHDSAFTGRFARDASRIRRNNSIHISLGCYHAMKIYDDELLEVLRALRQTYSDSRQPN
jgi:hypothetical protein